MKKRQRYPYPVPELIAYLEAMHDLEQDEQLDYLLLAKLLQYCHANQLWHAGRFTREDPEILTCQMVQFGFKRLIPLLLGAMVGGWHELLAYVEHPERFSWYNPDTDWPCAPPLAELRPEDDEVETINSDHEEKTDTENTLIASYTASLPS